jgi:hypothetical protein
MSMEPESESVQEHVNRDAQAPQERAKVSTRGAGRMRLHRLFAVLAVVGFAAHLATNLLTDVIYWLPEYIWFGSLVFSVLAIYTGASAAYRVDGAARGKAIASAVIGALVLLGLMYSAVNWLFMMGDTPGPAVGASYQAVGAAGLLCGGLSSGPRRNAGTPAIRGHHSQTSMTAVSMVSPHLPPPPPPGNAARTPCN